MEHGGRAPGGEDTVGRRPLLAAVGAGVVGATGGCVAGVTRGGSADGPVSMLAAGSLNDALENGLRPELDQELRVEARGSAAAARLVAGGQTDPDVVALSDVALFDEPLAADWYAAFATNAVVLAYDASTAGGSEVAAAGPDRWYEPLLSGAVALGRTDPDLDPLGYRTLFALDLATTFYETDADLRAAIPERGQVYPETQLVAQFETGGVEAAFAYRSMAVERGYEFVDLPPAVDLSDPARSDRYAETAYELPDGTVISGDAVRYGATARHDSAAVERVFDAVTIGDYLAEYGFRVPADYPRYTGDAPSRFAD